MGINKSEVSILLESLRGGRHESNNSIHNECCAKQVQVSELVSGVIRKGSSEEVRGEVGPEEWAGGVSVKQ